MEASSTLASFLSAINFQIPFFQHSGQHNIHFLFNRTSSLTDSINKMIQETPPPLQAVRRVYENKYHSSSSSSTASSSDIIHIMCHSDPTSGKDILLWDDIKAAFDDVLHVRSGTVVLPFVKGSDFKKWVYCYLFSLILFLFNSPDWCLTAPPNSLFFMLVLIHPALLRSPAPLSMLSSEAKAHLRRIVTQETCPIPLSQPPLPEETQYMV